MKHSIVPLCAAALLVALRASAGGTNTAAPAGKPAIEASTSSDPVIAKGKSVEVKRSELDRALQTLKTQAATEGKAIPAEQMAKVESGVLEHLIQTQILNSKATAGEKAKAKEAAQRQLDDARTNAPSEEAFNARLKAMGTSAEEIVRSMAEKGTAEAVIVRELKINVSEVDAKRFYDDPNNIAKFEQPEMVRASHILLMTQDPKTGAELSRADKDAKRKTMEGLLKRARAGEDFGNLAKEFSEDPGSKDNGGEYVFPRGKMVPEFESTAFALKTNEVSDIITTRFGYHIIKLSEHIPAQKVPFEKAAPQITNYLKQRELAKLAPEYIARIRKEAGVQILDEQLKQQELPPVPAGNSPLKSRSS